MTKERKSAEPSLAAPGGLSPDHVARPLTARSVIASTLLGIDPPRLSARLLARSGELFGISEGTTRVAISRMVTAGELEPDDGGYRLAGHLLDRQARQRSSRAPVRREWTGDWTMAVVADGRRSAPDRAELRAAMRGLRLAEYREGVWLRPDNLDPTRDPAMAAVLAGQCRTFTGRPDAPSLRGGSNRAATPDAGRELAATLWDLSAWSTATDGLRRDMDELVGPLEAGDTSPLPAGFVLSAEVLRHLLADPLLPDELLPPAWPGAALRDEYDRYDRAFKSAWREWFRAQPAG